MVMTVRTRFAPSPTGPLHIGSVRTALFNYLYSRHCGGEFLLRIEDTDRERSTNEAAQGILDSLDWLGLERDGETVYQSSRMARHAEVAYALLAAGKAYHCYCTPEELAREREQARAEKRVWRYDGRWRDRDPSDAPAGVTPVIRLSSEREGESVLEDLVQGQVRVANGELDDFIILRSDGTPIYLHAVVVDDHDMRISHVIRGDDHLINTFRQMQLDRGHGLGAAAVRTFAAHSRAGWRETVEAARRTIRAGIPRSGFFAGGAVQLSAAAWLVAW